METTTTSRQQTDEAGYLFDPSEWDQAFAEAAAAREGIALTPAHWAAITFMRDWLDAHQVAPDVRHVSKHLQKTLDGDRNLIFRLFPYGYVQQACKIAGMKRPRAWSTG